MICCANCDQEIVGTPHYHELRPEFERIPFCNEYCREEFLADFSFEQGEPYDDTYDVMADDFHDRYYDASPAEDAARSGIHYFDLD